MQKNTHKTQAAAATTAELKASTAVRVPKALEVEPPLTPEQEQTLAHCAERIRALGRKSTEQTFEYGEELAMVQAILPDKKFGHWLKTNAGISTKAAKNYTRVHKELSGYRERLEKSAVASTAMFALLGADDQAIEGVLDTIETGERLTVAKIKTMVGAETKAEAPAVNVLDMPGRAGCVKIAEQRMKANIGLFSDLLAKILVAVEEAVAKYDSGERVTKSGLAEAIEFDARHASDLFGLTLAPLYMDAEHPRVNWSSSRYGQSSTWGRLQAALHQLGGSGVWPTNAAFKTWIVDEVYPLLKFAVRGEPVAGGMPIDGEAVDTAAEAAAIHAAERQALDMSRVRIDPPEPQPGNVVELPQRQQVRMVAEALEA
ncbi:hypothetical protein JJB09_02495 [Rhizobium sp. KVB221]|uniref:DUF3102 domain-containing protein n=1 Tax=Rhizobium setariae TaxID=2801340 RepID=A0A936YIS3_9HYPH|nr:hypothetical protein [Rhizobium setariae]MBL0370888.1 hypothetical protein [Rhizobium setariae]